jgi:hypothetical protein
MILPTPSYGVDFFPYSTSKINLSAASQNDVNSYTSNFHNNTLYKINHKKITNIYHKNSTICYN